MQPLRQWPMKAAARVLLFAAVACAVACRRPPAVPYEIPPAIDDGWATESLDRVGIDRARLETMTGWVRATPALNVHAVLIERDGRLVYEEYFSGTDERRGRPAGVVAFTREMKHDIRSVTKSVISALVGIAAASGAIRSLDTPLLDYFPEYSDLQVPERRQLTIRHALTMSGGFDWNENMSYADPKNDETAMDRSADPLRYVLDRRLIAMPGTSWHYNGGTTQVVAAIVQRATKQPLVDYTRATLFAPLGITDFEWLGRLAGLPSAASGLRLRPRDLAKFGSLYIHDGQWNGHQVVPRGWIDESTRRQIAFPGQKGRGYGYLWWYTCYSTRSGAVEVPTAVGNGMQRVFVLRAQRTVVTVLSGRYNNFRENPPERLLLDYIIPALPRAPNAQCSS
jgi:CubicO group peptidase (beta-lactamase class C family)